MMKENSEISSNSTALSTTATSSSTSDEPASDKEPLKRKELPIAKAVEHYFVAISGIEQTAHIALPHIEKWKDSEMEKIQKKIEKFVPNFSKKGERTKTITLDSARDFAEFTNTIQQLRELNNLKSMEVLSKSLFTQLFVSLQPHHLPTLLH